MIESRLWVFRVSACLNPGEAVFLTGSCGILGSWDAEHLVPLSLEETHTTLLPETPTVWSVVLELPIQEIEYRFVICQPMRSANEIIYSVKHWEAHLHPRVVPANISNENEEPQILDFGYIDDLKKADEGWLVRDSCLFLRMCKSSASSELPVALWKKKHKDKKCYLKITPIDISKRTSVETLLDFHAEESTEAELAELRQKAKSLMPSVEVSVLRDGVAEFHEQEQFGVSCLDEEYLAFRCRLPKSLSFGFLVDFFSESSGDGRSAEPPKFIGSATLLSSSFQDTYGISTTPITSPKHVPIGQLSVSYMVVHPLDGPKCDLKVSYARYWKDSWKGLEVGHRGAGNSFHSQPKNCANIRENTIASLKHAFENGADMVEFDVQLSKDFVPLIYHDFHALIALKYKKEPLKTDLVEIPIKDLTLSQLQALRLYHKTERGESRFSDEDYEEDHQPFPSLEQVLHGVPSSCAFNIEIKWTMRLKDGSYELKHPFELNRFLDKILKVVLESKSPRKIIFSCFHPDICTMIRMKQNLYPVLFLTQGENSTWPPYEDFRTRSFGRAVHYAASANILGVNVHTSELLSDPSRMERALTNGLVVFCWGDQNSDTDTIRRLKDIGLHGIIYDKIDVYNTKERKRSNVFLCDDKDTCRCFPSSCRVVMDSSVSPPRQEKRPCSHEDASAKRSKGDAEAPPTFRGVLSNDLIMEGSVIN